MFTLKICGVTRVADAQAVAATSADAIGFNFYAGSKRFVEPRQAMHLAAVTGPGLVKVGVFVNADVETISGIADALGLGLIQLHGDEPPELVGELRERRIIRAFRVDERGLKPVAEYLDACRALNALPAAVLLDAFRPGEFGGTGATADWRRIADERPLLGGIPLILAGGLTPENVAEAISLVRPDAVDVAGGVESAPGQKDPNKLQAFVAAVRRLIPDPRTPTRPHQPAE